MRLHICVSISNLWCMWFEYMCAAAAAKVSIYAYNVFIIQASNVMSHCSINSRRPRALRLVLTHRRPAFFFFGFSYDTK